MSKKWLLRLKKKLVMKKLRLDWDRVGRASVKTPFPLCTKHHSIVEMFMKCGLCKSKLNLQSSGICRFVVTNSILFCFLCVKKIIDLPGGQINDPY